MPGHPFEPRAAGTNRLIKEGATVTTGAADIEDALRPLLAHWQGKTPRAGAQLPVQHAIAATILEDRNSERDSHETIGQAAKTILELLSFSPIDVDELCRMSGLEARHLHAALLSLDLSGRIERRGLRQVVLRP